MSDRLDRAVDARIDAYVPERTPPFASLLARKRSRDRRRIAAVGVSVLVVVVAAGSATLVPTLTGGTDRLVTGGATSEAPTPVPSAAASGSIEPSPSTNGPSTSTPPCRDQDLIAVATGGGAISNGFTGASIRLTNVGTVTCQLPARPTSLGTTDMPLPTEPGVAPHRGPQTLPPGGVAAFEISSMRVPGSGDCLRLAPAGASSPKRLVIKFDQTSAAIVVGLIGGDPFTLDCWPVQVGDMYLPAPASAPGSDAVWPADSDSPVAGVCGSNPGPEVLIEVNPDVPMPRCTTIGPDQRLRVRNSSNRYSQSGRPVIVWFAGYPARTIPVGGETLFDRPAGQYLAPGVHDLRLSLYPGSGGAEIWLQT
jgi:hypothetical protein